MDNKQVLAEIERLTKELSATCHEHGLSSIIAIVLPKTSESIFEIEGSAFHLLTMVCASINGIIEGAKGKFSYEEVMQIITEMMEDARKSGLLEDKK